MLLLKFQVVPACVSEAIVLRTYPLKEADLIVSFLTRDQGKLRGVAKRARRPKSVFGAGLERLSQVKLSYFQNPARELVNLDACDLIRSQFGLISDYTASVALDYLAEVSEQLLPPAEPNERWFRLLTAVLDHMQPGRADCAWRAVTYFTFWAVRLAGFLPDMDACSACRTGLEETAWFSRGFPGLYCGNCRVAGAGEWKALSARSRTIAAEMLRKPVGALCVSGWQKATAADLRKFLVERIESQIERRLVTAPVLEDS